MHKVNYGIENKTEFPVLANRSLFNKPIKSEKLTNLSYEEARRFFMDEKNYINFDLPKYFDFSDLLEKTNKLIFGRNLRDICKIETISGKPDWPKKHERVNYVFLSNKDGAFAWRPLHLIHPVLYVDLVNTITDENNWNIIIDRFKFFEKSAVECISIPRVSQSAVTHKASQVVHWWEEMEQRSIKMSLRYDYILSTDITNCYNSIYTHAIEWALTEGGKQKVKENIGNEKNNSLGYLIDEKLRNMNNGQTNGIPQGSTLMDFIAEVFLGYADTELTNIIKLNGIPSNEFSILRYRDDYRIFVNNPIVGHQILKYLNDILASLGMQMNPGKTAKNSDVILGSIKKEKLERILMAPIQQYYQKEALRIYQLSRKYPNSGLIAKELSLYFDRIEHKKYLKNTDIEVLISIFSMMALNSPKVINWISAILSILLEKIKKESRRRDIVKMIYDKFKNVPNTSLIDVWLQRITSPLGIEIDYKDRLTKLSLELIKNSDIWESSWLNEEVVKTLDLIKVSNLKNEIINETIQPVIPRDEVELFKTNYND